MIGVLFSLTLLAAFTSVDAWHAKFFPQSRKATIQQFSTQPKGFQSLQAKFNLPRIKAFSSLKFKVSESEEETEVDDEEIEFDDIGGSPMLRKLSKGKACSMALHRMFLNLDFLLLLTVFCPDHAINNNTLLVMMQSNILSCIVICFG